MRPSDWPLYAKLLAVVLTAGIVSVLGWAVRALFYDVLPVNVATHLSAAIVGAIIGAWFMERSLTRHFERRLRPGVEEPEDFTG